MRTPLTGILDDIAQATDAETALKVAEHFGGVRVYIPARPDPSHWLSQLVGHDKAVKISSALVAAQSGLYVLIPMSPAPRARNWKRIKNMIDEKVPVPQIARACGVHMRTVYFHKRQGLKRVSAALSQGDLFD